MRTPITRISLRLIPAVFLAAVLTHRSAEAAELSVCIDQSNPSSAMDVSIAKAVARQRVMAVKLVPFDGSGDDEEGLPLSTFPELLSGKCQLVMGFPLDADGGTAPPGTSATTPYAHTGFVLVTAARKHISTLEELPKGSEVAVTYMTTPNLYFGAHPRLTPQVFTSDADTLKAVVSGQAAAAMLWMPYVAGHLQGTAMQVSPLHEPHAQWNLVALYASTSGHATSQFEAGIRALHDNGELQKLVQRYGETAGAVASARPHPVSLPSKPAARHLIKVNASVPGAAPMLYSAAQAEAGRQKFRSNCAMCHGTEMEGRAGPALKGPIFANPNANFHVGDIFKIVAENMPAPAPGSLPHGDYVDIMAFILQQNGYPAGTAALTYDGAMQSKVPLIYRVPPAT